MVHENIIIICNVLSMSMPGLAVYVKCDQNIDYCKNFVGLTDKYNENNTALGNIADPDWSNLHELGSFEQQADYFLYKIRMSRVAAHNYTILLRGLKWELGKLWPDFEMTPYGAVVNGLALASSDLDVFITINEKSAKRQEPSERIQKTAEFLKNSNFFSNVKPDFSHSVPVLSVTYIPTNQNCDITYKKYESKGDTRLIKYLFQTNRKASELMLIVKYWAKSNKLSRPDVAMSNIAWYFLVVFYLQQLKILPPIYVLQRLTNPAIIEHWNLNFGESYEYLYESEKNYSLYELLGGFFVYYSNFDFANQCVSIFAGKTVPRKLFKNFETLPDIFDLYKFNLRFNLSDKFNISSELCVQRTFVHNDNVAKKADSNLASKIIKSIRQAAVIFKMHKKEYFLGTFLTIPNIEIFI